MPGMTDEEKAARLLFYKRQAQAQWDDREAALWVFSKPFHLINPRSPLPRCTGLPRSDGRFCPALRVR